MTLSGHHDGKNESGSSGKTGNYRLSIITASRVVSDELLK